MINQEEIKSQDDVVVNQGGRSSDVLVATIEKCEKLEIQNKILKKALIELLDYTELDDLVDYKEKINEALYDASRYATIGDIKNDEKSKSFRIYTLRCLGWDDTCVIHEVLMSLGKIEEFIVTSNY